ncbi:SH3 domain-containing lethal (3) 05822 isoform 1-T3 [Cochliomyia hominivorax]
MTLPTRPAPAPPGSRAQNAAANANASLEQLRLQLQQQQQLQRSQHNVTVPKLTIKLPPPPKQPVATNAHNGVGSISGNGSINNNNSSSITRKFPQARYAPATNWDDSPFDILAGNTGFGNGVGSGSGGGLASTNSQTSATTNGNFKKQPPPRPPPPKVQPKKGTAPTPPIQQSTNILSNIFHLKKKSSRAPTPNNASRIYGSATYGTTTNSSSTKISTTSTLQSNGITSSSSLSTDWNSAWNNAPNYNSTSTTATATTHHTATTEAQLISFDSPPSSPTFTQKSNSDCLSVDSFSSDSNFSSPNNGSVSQPESGFEDDFGRSRPATTSPLDPWEALDAFGHTDTTAASSQTATQQPRYGSIIGTAPVRNLSTINTRLQVNGDNPLCNGKSLLPPAPALNMPTIIKPKISQKPKAPKPPLLAKPSNTSLYSDNLITPPSPPMPQCAPPTLPPTAAINSSFPATTTTSSTTASMGSTYNPNVSILDVITGKADARQLNAGLENYDTEPLEPPHGIALYDFDSTEDGDLCFRENEKIYLLEQVTAEWYKGRTRSGCEGIFPINYIEIKVPLPSKTESSANSTQSSSASTTPTYQTATTTANNSNLKVRSLYNFPAEVEGDLELKENDLVTILHRINEDWLYGEVNGRQGQFPANFLEYVPSNIPMP